MSRPSWDQYFMGIAVQAAERSTCDQRHAGALIVRDRVILSTGYTGSIRNYPHCGETGHLIEPGSEECQAVIHAEANAIVQAARVGMRIEGATLYSTGPPCWPCFKAVVNAGIERIAHAGEQPTARVQETAEKLGLKLDRLEYRATTL